MSTKLERDASGVYKEVTASIGDIINPATPLSDPQSAYVRAAIFVGIGMLLAR